MASIRLASRYRLLFSLTLLCLLPSVTVAQDTIPYDSLRVDGTWLFYRQSGEGEPLLLLHGFTGSGRTWDDTGLLKVFATNYHVIVPDLRGRGRSVDPDGDLYPARSAEDMIHLLDHLGLRAVKSVGLSFGALVQLHMATAHPERMKEMVLISGGPYLPQQTRIGIRRDADPGRIPPPALEQMARMNHHAGGAAQQRQLLQAFYDAPLNYDLLNFTPPYLSTITAPVLIVHGDRDMLFPVDLAMEMYRAMPHAYLWVLPDQGHGTMMESPTWVTRLSATAGEFLSGAWADQAPSAGR